MTARFRFPLQFTRFDRSVLAGIVAVGLTTSALAGDGRPEFPLSVADARDRAEARFQAMDADRSGEVSPAEFAAAAPELRDRFPGPGFQHPGKHAEHRHAAMQERIFTRLDRDGSGGLSRSEIPDPSRWLEAMDADGDGTVTRAEAREHRQAHGQRSG